MIISCYSGVLYCHVGFLFEPFGGPFLTIFDDSMRYSTRLSCLVSGRMLSGIKRRISNTLMPVEDFDRISVVYVLISWSFTAKNFKVTLNDRSSLAVSSSLVLREKTNDLAVPFAIVTT